MIVWCGAASASAQSTNHISVEDLRRVQLPDVTIESATSVVPDAQKNPRDTAYVEVKGVIGGNIRFELLLPLAWNGRFVMGGGGGFVGTVQNSARGSVNAGYATVGTDTGHESQPGHMAGWGARQSGGEAGLRLPCRASDGGSCQGVDSRVLRRGYVVLLLHRLLAGGGQAIDGGATVSEGFRRHRGRRTSV